jgi:hypothetical protein
MKKIIILTALTFSFTSFANITCDGGGVTVDINESSKTLTLEGFINGQNYHGTISKLGGSGEEFSGSTSEGNFRGLTINIDDGELEIINANGKRLPIIDVNCD